MRRRLRPLGLVGLLALTCVSGAISASSAAPGPAWDKAIEVPGIATLNSGGGAYVLSVSCASARDCAAGGHYTDGSGDRQAFVVSERHGVWGNAIEVPGTAALNIGGGGEVDSVSCAAVGECAASGFYGDANGHGHAFVVSETNGVWGNAIEVPGLEHPNTRGHAQAISVSCGAVGDCAASGQYADGSGAFQAFVVSETNGHWHKAIEVPGTAALNTGGYAWASSVSCVAAGECTAGGIYIGGSSQGHAFVVREKNGVWGMAMKVPAPSGGSGAGISAVSCAAAGDCAAVGEYEASSGSYPAFVVSEKNGVWGGAIAVPGAAALNNNGTALLTSVSCGAVGDCVAGGVYLGGAASHQSFVVSERHGVWGNGIEVPGIAALNTGGYSDVNSVSCGGAGDCTAGGFFDSGSGWQAFVASETNGQWHTAIEVPGTAALNRGDAVVYSVSCARAGGCAAGGMYKDGAGQQQAFVVSPRPARRLRAGRTTCNGMYTGTGRYVEVPAGDTCTLVRGTHVIRDVTVVGGGTLVARGVTIDGALTIAGGATVCYSQIAGDVTALSAQGSLHLGGGSCQHGNTFLHGVLVKNASHGLVIQGNQIADNLAVLNGLGATTSIVRNTVRNLVVSHSGPVVIKDNRAKNSMRCTGNDPQTGSGNTAHGTNTCPR